MDHANDHGRPNLRCRKARNIVVVDRESGARRSVPNCAAYNINSVGRQVAHILQNPEEFKGLDLNRLDFVGHSFGAYVAYAAVKDLGRARYLTALDPAAERGLNKLDMADFNFSGEAGLSYSVGYHSSCAGSPYAFASEDYVLLNSYQAIDDRHGFAPTFWTIQTAAGLDWGIKHMEILPRVPLVTHWRTDFEGALLIDGTFLPRGKLSSSLLTKLQCKGTSELKAWVTKEVVKLVAGLANRLAESTLRRIPTIRPVDPNDMLGPEGYGDAHWLAASSLLGYTIRFENDPALATAPAQNVTIRQRLDTDLDPRTFRLGSFGFGAQVVEVPANRSFYSTRLDLTGELGLFVDVTAGIDIVTNEAFWIFQSIDPATGAPPTDAAAGFLPPDIVEGEGQGFVTYQVRTKSSVQPAR